MAYSSRSTSPDPLALPSSPLSAHSGIAERRTSKPLAPRSSNINNVSPSKSFIMDTGKAGDMSPWRIKVTVHAEPKDGSSPAKKMVRTTTVPLKGGSSSSPARKSGRPRRRSNAALSEDSEVEIRRPQRKRKGTPIRRTTRKSQPTSEERDAEGHDREDGNLMSQQLREEFSSPSKRPTPPRRTREPRQAPTERSKRLSQAREELNLALHEAVGTDDEDLQHDQGTDMAYDHAPGDMTVANEDFTMVSVDTLQSMKQNTSQLLDNSEVEKSGISVSYMPSSPPEMARRVRSADVQDAQYPDISVQAEEAKSRPPPKSIATYDAMSWKPTGPAKMTTPSNSGTSRQSEDREPIEWHEERQAVSRLIKNASPSNVIVIDEDEAEVGAPEHSHGESEASEEDIWAEEASRSLDEEPNEHAASAIQPANTAAALNDLFSDQPNKPPRGKIPRTWRRSSGMDFSYVDSPEHGALKPLRKVSATDTEGENGSRSSGGVLTPPESSDEQDDDAADPTLHNGEDDEADLTHPDAAATQLQAHGRHAPSSPAPALGGAVDDRSQVRSPDSDSSSNVTSPNSEGEDTGMFWQTNLPSIYHRRERPRIVPKQKERAVDLSELLRREKSSSPLSQQTWAGQRTQGGLLRPRVLSTESPPQKRFARGKTEKVMSSPLRHSLLKSSKLGGSVLPTTMSPVNITTKHSPKSVSMRIVGAITAQDRTESSQTDGSFMESFESKASDQRQLLNEMKSVSTQDQHNCNYYTKDDAQEQLETDNDELDEESRYHASGDESQIREESEREDYEDLEYSEEEENSRHHSQSYEEHLNIESPQKIRVNFNDSEGNSSLLAPRREYKPLFGVQSAISAGENTESSPPSVTLVSKESLQQGGIFSRLSTTFWSAVIRPSGPTFVSPERDPEYSPSLRAQIRNRYGVLSDQHPWTMAHMRTLHRLLNSCTSGKCDSIVPKNGPLPSSLKHLIGKDLQCVTEFRWKFTEQHAHVVDAFMQVLVPAHYIEAMKHGEVEFIGDPEAKKYRGSFGGRHGDDLVFQDVPGLKLPKGTVSRDFVVKALGNAISANVETARKEAEKGVRVEHKSEESPRDISSKDEDFWTEESSIEEGSEVLHRVSRM